jgi:hypothetical protein
MYCRSIIPESAIQGMKGQPLTNFVKTCIPKQPSQNDGTSCGVHALVAVDAIANDPPAHINAKLLAQRTSLQVDQRFGAR